MLIDVLIDGKPGKMDNSLLVRKEGIVDNANEHTTWVEYRLNGVVVHRSAHVTLKPQAMKPETGALNS